jgi:hypothetical protein
MNLRRSGTNWYKRSCHVWCVGVADYEQISNFLVYGSLSDTVISRDQRRLVKNEL